MPQGYRRFEFGGLDGSICWVLRVGFIRRSRLFRVLLACPLPLRVLDTTYYIQANEENSQEDHDHTTDELVVSSGIFIIVRALHRRGVCSQKVKGIAICSCCYGSHNSKDDVLTVFSECMSVPIANESCGVRPGVIYHLRHGLKWHGVILRQALLYWLRLWLA